MGILFIIMLVAQHKSEPIHTEGIISKIKSDVEYFDAARTFHIGVRNCYIEKGLTLVVDWDNEEMSFDQIQNGDKVKASYILGETYRICWMQIQPRHFTSDYDFSKIQERWITEVIKPKKLEDILNSEEVKLIKDLNNPKWSIRQDSFENIQKLRTDKAIKIIIQASLFYEKNEHIKQQLKLLRHYFHTKVFDLQEIPHHIVKKLMLSK